MWRFLRSGIQDPVSAYFSKISTGYQEANYALPESFFIPLINWLFSALLNVTKSTYDKGYLCATDKEGFSTSKRCFLVAFTDGVGENERNLTPPKSVQISQLNLQGLFFLLARRFYIFPDVLLFLYLSITA